MGSTELISRRVLFILQIKFMTRRFDPPQVPNLLGRPTEPPGHNQNLVPIMFRRLSGACRGHMQPLQTKEMHPESIRRALLAFAKQEVLF